jgi:hypothetical protein
MRMDGNQILKMRGKMIFNIGDKVRVIKNYVAKDIFLIGMVGTIVEIEGYINYIVRFDIAIDDSVEYLFLDDEIERI